MAKGAYLSQEHNLYSMAVRTKVLLDLLAFSPTDGGFTTSIVSLLNIAQQLPEFEFGILYHKKYEKHFSGFNFAKHPVAFPEKLKFLATQIIVPYVARRYAYDLAHSEIAAAAMLANRTSMRVHDLYFVIAAGQGKSGWIVRAYERFYFWLYLRSIESATRVAAISECTKSDIVKFTRRRHGIQIVPHSIKMWQDGNTSKWPTTSEPLRLLFIGSVVPRKNLKLLVAALRCVRRPWHLEIIGNVWWGANELEPLKGDPRVTIHGFVDDERMTTALLSSHLLVCPSLYEGFGLPVAEAIARGCVAITSDCSAFREYVPDSARFDPRDAKALASIFENMTEGAYSALRSAEMASVRKYTIDAQRAAYRRLFGTGSN